MSSSLCQGPGAASPPAPLSITGGYWEGGGQGLVLGRLGPWGCPCPPTFPMGSSAAFPLATWGQRSPQPLSVPPPCCSPEPWPLHPSPVLVPVLRGLAPLLAQGPTANRRGWEGCGVGGALPHIPPKHHHGARKPSVPCPGAEGAESPARCSRSAWLRVLGVVGGPHPARPRRKSRGRRDRTAPLRHPPGLSPVHTAPPATSPFPFHSSLLPVVPPEPCPWWGLQDPPGSAPCPCPADAQHVLPAEPLSTAGRRDGEPQAGHGAAEQQHGRVRAHPR